MAGIVLDELIWENAEQPWTVVSLSDARSFANTEAAAYRAAEASDPTAIPTEPVGFFSSPDAARGYQIALTNNWKGKTSNPRERQLPIESNTRVRGVDGGTFVRAHAYRVRSAWSDVVFLAGRSPEWYVGLWPQCAGPSGRRGWFFRKSSSTG